MQNVNSSPAVFTRRLERNKHKDVERKRDHRDRTERDGERSDGLMVGNASLNFQVFAGAAPCYFISFPSSCLACSSPT